MIFNFTEKYKFTSKLTMDSQRLELVEEAKLLGVILTSDLKWFKNTSDLVKNGNARMDSLRKMSSYSATTGELVHIYTTYNKKNPRAVVCRVAQHTNTIRQK